MMRFFKASVCFCLIFSAFAIFTACKKEPETAKSGVMIGKVAYSSLTDAVQGAKSGDTIKVYDDVVDHKNVVINKPINIKGVVKEDQIRPKFYGSFTIDLDSNDGSATIENLDIVHDGVEADGANNNTLVGVNLLDGGLEMKKNKVSLNQASTADDGASGVVLSRRNGSKNTMPIIVRGNSFDAYKAGSKPSGAMLIRQGGQFEKLGLSEDKLYSDNVFSSAQEGNMFISIDYSASPFKFPFFVTSSADEMLGALASRQSTSGSSFTLIAQYPAKSQQDELTIKDGTSLNIEGNGSADMGGITLIVDGALNADGGIENVTLKRGNSVAGIVLGDGVDKNKVTIIK